MATEWRQNSEPETGYHLIDDRPFARGGSGEVWKAVGPGGVRVVLKRVPLAGRMVEAERKSLELLRNISGHPHLMGIHGFWLHETELVIATELASESLIDRLRRTGNAGVPVAELLDYMEDAAKGIDFLNAPIHELDGKKVAVQHRDVKPANLLVVGGSVKLSDFGLAKALERQTTSHTGVMTPAYAAPESFLHQTSSRSDQYSLAVSYVELRTGHVIFSGSVAQVMYGHIHGQPDLSGLTQAERAVVGRALSKKPEDRFETCREFVTNLRQAIAVSSKEPAMARAAAERLPSPAAATQNAWAAASSDSGSHTVVAATSAPPAPVPALSLVSTSNSPFDTVPAPKPTPPPAMVAPAAPSAGTTESSKGLWIGLFAAVAIIAVCAFVLTQHMRQKETAGALLNDTRASRAQQARGQSKDPSPTDVQNVLSSNADQARGLGESSPGDGESEQLPSASNATEKPPVQSKSEVSRTAPPKDDVETTRIPPQSIRDRETPAEPENGSASIQEQSSPDTATRPSESNARVAAQAYTLLKKYCYRCHGVDFKVPGYNVLDRDSLLATRGPDELPYIALGKPDESAMWLRIVVDGDMPPSGAKPTDDEKQLLKRWIEGGAPFPLPPAEQRQFQAEREILAAVADHLRKTPIADRPFQRYFTLTHLHNNKTVRDDELRLYRAALSKIANSVSWKHAIAVPRAIDDAQTILSLDLRDFGWDENNLWKEILKVYPYGLKHSQHRDESVRDLALEVYHQSGSDLPYLRADWFVATAARPPLYHTLLRLPKSAAELEGMLKVDVIGDFLRNKIARAGFATSGVSTQNRIVDRHASAYGAYWKSYDFSSSEGRSNIFQNPLGPAFPQNPFGRQAFEHAGGELIFSLPNGLHGYLLLDQKGERIDEGPIEIVHDELKTAGTPAIVAGLSCMSCHKHGMIRFQDTLRDGQAVNGEAREKIEILALKQEMMDKLLAKDEDQFLRALDEATAGFLKVGEDRDKNIRQFPEPVGAIARLYLKDLGPQEIACELGLADYKELQGAIRGNRRLRELGLGPIMQGAKIKREAWETLKAFNSPMQDSARELEQGTPFRVF
jgi:serine/threonine-protein kinase